jgi:hypothetical protein
MPKIFWGAWPLIILNCPNFSKVLVSLSKLSVSKNVWFTNAILGPLDFIHSEMLKMGMGRSGPSRKQPVESTISGAGPPLWTNQDYISCRRTAPFYGDCEKGLMPISCHVTWFFAKLIFWTGHPMQVPVQSPVVSRGWLEHWQCSCRWNSVAWQSMDCIISYSTN